MGKKMHPERQNVPNKNELKQKYIKNILNLIEKNNLIKWQKI